MSCAGLEEGIGSLAQALASKMVGGSEHAFALNLHD